MCTISTELDNKITEMVQENHPTISLTGFKNVGKATTVEALAKSNEVAKLLGLRENAAANKAKIIVTDCDEISAFDLFVHAKLCYKSLADFRNDYTLIYVLYDMYEVYLKNGDYSGTMKNSLKKYIASNDKTSFYYLTKFANENTIMKLCQILNKISMLLFDSWFKTLDSCVRNKYELLSEIRENDSPFKGIYVEFYEAMIERYNECINEVLAFVKERGGCSKLIRDTSEVLAFVKERGGCSKLIKDANEVVITVALTTKDCSHRYTKLLLQGKDMSLLTPVSDLTLIFRGISFLNSESTGSLFSGYGFNQENSYRCVNFINTEDFTEFTTESYGYEDYINYILKPFIDESFRTGKVLFVIDSTCAEEQLAKLSEIISYVTNPINLCILFTNVDNLMLSFADKYCSECKFSEKFKVHWKNCYNDAYDFLNSLLNDFKDNLPDNNTVLSVEANLAALDLMINEELKSVVDNNGISYPLALLKSVNMLLNKNNASKKPTSIGSMSYF